MDNKPHKHPRAYGRQQQGQTALLQAMACLIPRHEDTLNAAMREQFLAHRNRGPGSILKDFITNGQEWRAMKDKQVPLRHFVAVNMMQLLHARLTMLSKAAKTEDLWKDCVKYHIVDDQILTPYLRWDTKLKFLVPTKDKEWHSTKS